MSRLKNVILDADKFAERHELEDKVHSALEKMSLKDTKFANKLLEGYQIVQAMKEAGIARDKHPEETDKQYRANLYNLGQAIREKKQVKQYLSASLKLAQLVSLQEIGFSHAQWLEKQREVLEMALGQKEIPKVFLIDGQVCEQEVKDACLGVANKSLETIARHYGWLNDKVKVDANVKNAVVSVKDFTGQNQSTDEDDDE